MALNKIQSLVLELVAASPLSKNFYWTDGTLLAERYLHHRKSYDVDLFTEKPFMYETVAPLIQELKEKTGLRSIEEKKVFDRWEFFIHNHDEVRVEFVHYNFPALKSRKRINGIFADSLEDLAANKTMAVVDRHEPKDVVDIFFLMRDRKFDSKKLLRLAKKKFGLAMDESTLLGQILFGAKRLLEIQPMLYGTKPEQLALIQEIQNYFKHQSTRYLRSLLD